MSSSIIEQLAERFGIHTDDAAQALNTYVQEVKQQAVTVGHSSLPGLGILHLEEDTLSFVPDPALGMIANYRYAGLEVLPLNEPVEPEPEEEEPPPPEPEMEEPSEETFVIPEPEVADPPPEPEEEEVTSEWESPEPEGEHPLGPMPTAPFEEPDFALVDGDEVEEEEAPSEPETELQAEALPEEAPTQEEDLFEMLNFAEEPEAVPLVEESPEPVAEEEPETAVPLPPPPKAEDAPPQPPPEKKPPRSRVPKRKEPANRGFWITLFVVAMALGVALAYAILRPETTTTTGETPPITQNDTTATTTTPSDTSATATTDPTSTTDPQPQQLGGIDRNAGGFTIVVASETSRGAAESAAQAYFNLGHPVDILVGRRGGTTRYRVAVGQFRSQRLALSAKRQMAGSVPSDAWPLRIGRDM